MSTILFFKKNLLWKYGKEYIAFCVILFIFGIFIYVPLLLISAVVFLFFLWFFRNPEAARLQVSSSVLTSPADGTVVGIKEEGEYTVISIFLSPFNVHVNWAPMDGTVMSMVRREGAHYPAMVEKSSELNEAVTMTLQDDVTKKKILIRQIAGILARRIISWVSPGQHLAAGDPFGMIKLGSRIDVFVPQPATILVTTGERVYGVKSAIAQLN